MRIDSSFSGLLAARTRVDVAANNVANANTAGHRGARAELAANPNGGVDIQAITTPADPGDPNGPSNVSVASELAELAAAKHTYTANAKLARMALELEGQLIDRRV